MIPIGTIVKWGAITLIVSTLAYGIKRGYEYHLDQIDAAVNMAKIEFVLEKEQALNEREDQLRELAKLDREAIEVQLRAERNKIKDLRKLLLIRHDLDRLLQEKPGLILPRVNAGTQAYFKELEEATQ